jgi:hypothetical protein
MALNCQAVSLAPASRAMRRVISVATEPVMRRLGAARWPPGPLLTAATADVVGLGVVLVLLHAATARRMVAAAEMAQMAGWVLWRG